MAGTIENQIRGATQAGRLHPPEDDLIRAYLDWRHSVKGNSEPWLMNMCHQLIQGARLLHERREVTFEKASTEDVHNVISAIRSNGYKPNYKRQLIQAVRGFSFWLSETGKAPGISKEIRSVKLPKGQWKTKEPEDMLTKDEITALLTRCHGVRDRCLISMLYDTSCRPIELLSLTWGDIREDEFGAYFETERKTGRKRRIRLTFSLPYLQQWKKACPMKDKRGKVEKTAPVFITTNLMGGKHLPMNKNNLDRVIRYLKEETGITKLKPSIFRPSRITADIQDGAPLAYVALKNWGNLKSPMIDLYTNPSKEYLDQEALRLAGMDRREEEKKAPEPITAQECPACHAPYILGMRYCGVCGLGLTEEARSGVESKEKEAQESEDYKRLLTQIRKDLGIKR